MLSYFLGERAGNPEPVNTGDEAQRGAAVPFAEEVPGVVHAANRGAVTRL